MKCVVQAPSNIALIKYWGKRDKQQNLPISSSLSASLSNLYSTTSVEASNQSQDHWVVFGDPSKAERVLQEARTFTQNNQKVRISIENSFPSGAGLASSASSMASLAMALNLFLANGSVELQEVQRWARLGSGSSVRSFFPGYVLWEAGREENGEDCRAFPFCQAQDFPMDVLVCVVDNRPKSIGSTQAMILTEETSDFSSAFHEWNQMGLQKAQQALLEKDFDLLADVSQKSSLKMHQAIEKAGIHYLSAQSHEIIQWVREQQQQGKKCFFSMDAGPNVKVFCQPQDTQELHKNLKKKQGILEVIESTVLQNMLQSYS